MDAGFKQGMLDLFEQLQRNAVQLHYTPAAEPLAPGARLADVGTGAGFPGVPLKLLRPDLSLTLLDSLRKRIVFLQQKQLTVYTTVTR